MTLLVGATRDAAASQACLISLNSPAAGVYNSVTGHIGANAPGSDSIYYAGTFDIQVDTDPTTVAYCVDLQHNISTGDCVPQIAATYPCAVVYILNNFYPNAPAVLAPADEAAAVQAAIWSFTDSFTIDGPSSIQSRTAAIIAAASTKCANVPPVPQTITITPSAGTTQLPQTADTVTATVRDSNNNPVVGSAITVTVTGVSGSQTFPGTTDGNGQFAVTYTNAAAMPGVDDIEASVSFTVPVGEEFKSPTLQGIVLAGTPAAGSVDGTATETWDPPPPTTTTSTTIPTTTSTTSSTTSTTTTTTSSTTTTTTPGSTTTTSTTLPYQCYEVDGAVFAAPGLTVTDRYGASTVDIIRPKRVCNPADENHQDPAAVMQPDHLAGYDIQQVSPRFAFVIGQQVTNQFGTITVELVRPQELLVPAAANLSGPPSPLVTPVVDHLKCYQVKGVKQRASGIEVEDDFGSLTVDLKKPYRLCTAADVDGGGILDPSAALLCYKVHLAHGTPPFHGPPGQYFIDDELQATGYDVHHLREFCVPSTVN